MRAAAWWFVAAGVLVSIRAAIELAEPAYWSPTSAMDYAAVLGTTAAWLATAVAIVLLGRLPMLRRARWALTLGALGVAISAVGNLLEDLMDVPLGADLFTWGGIGGFVGVAVGSVLVLIMGGRLRWAGLFLLGFLAGGMFPDDGGQFLSGVALLGLGRWLLVRKLTREDSNRT